MVFFQISMSDLMMNIHTFVTDNTAYAMLLTPWCGVWQITMSDLMMNVHTCVTDNTTFTTLCVRSICQI
jgi:hypothetical protein